MRLPTEALVELAQATLKLATRCDNMARHQASTTTLLDELDALRVKTTQLIVRADNTRAYLVNSTSKAAKRRSSK